MKILIFSDVHWSATTSIVVARGERFSKRLQYLQKTLQWVNAVAKQNCCEAMVCAGDFFDKSSCSDQEITALKEIQWLSDIPYYFIVGNHESSVNSLEYSVTNALATNNIYIIDKPQSNQFDDCTLHFLPYVSQPDRRPLSEYLVKPTVSVPQIVFSHNDIAGINYGGFISTAGFSCEQIQANCDIFLNGHLHNSQAISKKILNLGSVSAHNFTNDSARYAYGVWLLDTSAKALTFFENPHSLNFYKIQLHNQSDLAQLHNLKQQAVLSIKCTEELLSRARKLVMAKPNILQTRFTTVKQLIEGVESARGEELSVDHFARFKEACIARFGESQVLYEQLAQICR